MRSVQRPISIAKETPRRAGLDLFPAIYTIYSLYLHYLQDFRKQNIPGSVWLVILFFVDDLYVDRCKGAHS